MRYFRADQLRDAMQHAADGGQALYIYPAKPEKFPKAPECFKKTKTWAYLFDRNYARLGKTANQLGVKKVKIEKGGRPTQHVDLCGGPLGEAIKKTKEEKDYVSSGNENG